MLEPKDKAIELLDKFVYYVESYSSNQQEENAKQCALIAVDELLQDHLQDQTDTKFYYWQEVKKQIELL